jgi:hypothetical protein
MRGLISHRDQLHFLGGKPEEVFSLSAGMPESAAIPAAGQTRLRTADTQRPVLGQKRLKTARKSSARKGFER